MALAAALSLAWAVTARADDASEAQLQYELGRELYSQRRFPEALERFIASNRLVPNANVVFNIAQTYQLMNRPAEAYNWFETYLEFELDADARTNGTELRDALLPRVAVVDVRTEPAGATLYVDRRDLGAVGRGPRRVAVEGGQRTILASLDGYRDGQVVVEANRGQVTTAELALERRMGTLSVQTDPPGATVHVEGRAEPLGTTPFEVGAPVGSHRLTLSLGGHNPMERTVEVAEGQTAVVQVTLSRGAGTAAVLSVNGVPEGAAVSIDGRPAGRTPLTLSELDPGVVMLEVAAEGRDPWAGQVTLEAGAAARVDYELADPSDRMWPGWWWLGYGGGGALLATGLVTGLVASSERSSFFDDPSREQLDRVGTLNVAADVLMIGGLVIVAATLVIDLITDAPRGSHGDVTLDR